MKTCTQAKVDEEIRRLSSFHFYRVPCCPNCYQPCLEMQSFSKVVEFDKEKVVKRSATILHEIVLKFIEDSPSLPWPPSIERLTSDERQCPWQLKLFFKVLLLAPEAHHTESEIASRLSDSFSQDVIYAVSRGTFITLKHACIGLGLHSLTGQKLTLVVLSRFGHCINYEQNLRN